MENAASLDFCPQELSILEAIKEIYGHTDDQGRQQAACLVHNDLHFPWQCNPAIWRSSGLPQIDTLAVPSFERFHYQDELSNLLANLRDNAIKNPGKDAYLTWKAIDMNDRKTYQFEAFGRLALVDDIACRLIKFTNKTSAN